MQLPLAAMELQYGQPQSRGADSGTHPAQGKMNINDFGQIASVRLVFSLLEE
jgi:hypothetical protein